MKKTKYELELTNEEATNLGSILMWGTHFVEGMIIETNPLNKIPKHELKNVDQIHKVSAKVCGTLFNEMKEDLQYDSFKKGFENKLKVLNK